MVIKKIHRTNFHAEVENTKLPKAKKLPIVASTFDGLKSFFWPNYTTVKIWEGFTKGN